ncbi:MAG TPA: hypothetical protein VLQ92_12445 [Candidatus Limnocylindrales bacterium]|nr:hypothetical protein [Candidatus Limnocylindrales bacterium]
MDSNPGPVSIVVLHRTAGEARRIAEEQLVRAGASRASGPGGRWMTRPTAPVLTALTAPVSVEPAATGPVPTDPAPTAPVPTDPAPTEPTAPTAPTEPAPDDGVPTTAEPGPPEATTGDGHAREFGQGSP